MMTLRCIHPPSGAVALTAVLGGHAVTDLGYTFVLWPVGANSLLLLASALAFNNLVGRTYPHRPAVARPDHQTKDPPIVARVGVSAADLDAALADFDDLFDIDRGDLEAILRDAELRSYRRRSGHTTCASVMSRDIVAVAPGAPISEALALMRAHHVKVVPVTDEGARVIGIVTQTDLLDKPTWDAAGPRLGFGRRIHLTAQRGIAPHGCVADIMTTPVVTATPDLTLADLLRLMARTGLHHLPVVDSLDRRLAGVVSQSDLALTLLAEASRSQPEARV
jgi:CBS domain-containing membrane protein